MAAGFGKQVATVKAAAAVHHSHGRGDVARRTISVDHGGDPAPDLGSCGAGVTGIAVRYGNGRWGRTADKNYEQHMAELNAKAFE
ncbi:hypothetical protein BCL80_11554 [Streptomyces avidinii]|nr:hypothetical protein BCL80_11554 [Streptomyces avidinii]SNX80859.1 hypothetical protein SAMN05421860_11354 [Streptomyces microflavus]